MALILLGACARIDLKPLPRSNIVYIVADDLGYGDLGCYSHPILRTPNIDRIAREGTRFDSAFLTISSCSPSRASILTGLYPHQTGAGDLHQPLPENLGTVDVESDQRGHTGSLHRPFPERRGTTAMKLGGSGYHTLAVGKWHLGPHEKAHWKRIDECQAGEFGDRAVAALRDRPKDVPFFAWLASHDPHRPFGDAPQVHDPARVVVPPYLPDHRLIRKEIAQYYDEIVRLDRHVGEILAELERQGALENTVVVFLSDNGMPFPRAKTTLYDSGIRTPLLMRGPGIARGSVEKGLVSSVQLAARPDAPPGAVEAVFAEANWHDYDQFSRAVRTESFLLVRNYYWDKPLWNSVDSINSDTWKGYMEMAETGKLTEAQRFLMKEPRPFEEFYDLRRDPHSLVNVAGDPRYSDPLNTLRVMLDEWRIATNDRMPEQRTPDGWTRDGIPLPHNQPWYNHWKREGKSSFGK